MALLINDILGQIALIPRAMLLTALAALGTAFLRWGTDLGKWRISPFLRRWRVGLFLIYCSYLLVSTVLSRETRNPCQNVFSHFGLRKDELWNIEIIENILFFIPYTLLFLSAFKVKDPWAASFFLSAASSCVIEGAQLLFWLGEFQFSDMVYNLFGGMIGCGLWKALFRIRGKTASFRKSDMNREPLSDH